MTENSAEPVVTAARVKLKLERIVAGRYVDRKHDVDIFRLGNGYWQAVINDRRRIVKRTKAGVVRSVIEALS